MAPPSQGLEPPANPARFTLSFFIISQRQRSYDCRAKDPSPKVVRIFDDPLAFETQDSLQDGIKLLKLEQVPPIYEKELQQGIHWRNFDWPN
jgi:hypothetical protein